MSVINVLYIFHAIIYSRIECIYHNHNIIIFEFVNLFFNCSQFTKKPVHGSPQPIITMFNPKRSQSLIIIIF